MFIVNQFVALFRWFNARHDFSGCSNSWTKIYVTKKMPLCKASDLNILPSFIFAFCFFVRFCFVLKKYILLYICERSWQSRNWTKYLNHESQTTFCTRRKIDLTRKPPDLWQANSMASLPAQWRWLQCRDARYRFYLWPSVRRTLSFTRISSHLFVVFEMSMQKRDGTS